MQVREWGDIQSFQGAEAALLSWVKKHHCKDAEPDITPSDCILPGLDEDGLDLHPSEWPEE